MPVGVRLLCLATPLILAVTGFYSQILADWWLENLAIFLAITVLCAVHRRVPLSTTSYALLFLFLCAHEYGALYSYSSTPLGEWAMPLLGTSRNHYDRLVHFRSGIFLALPAYEGLASLTQRSGAVVYFLVVQFVMALGALYEIAEWIVAGAVDPKLGLEFIGAQGDGWDAAKDMGLALVGVVLGVCLVALSRRQSGARLDPVDALRTSNQGKRNTPRWIAAIPASMVARTP